MKKNYTIILLDTADQVRKSMIQFFSTKKSFEAFNDVGKCVDYVLQINQEKIFLIISGSDAAPAVPILDESVRVDSIFILCSNGSKNEEWLLSHPKVKGVFDSITRIFEHIEETQHSTNNNISFDVVSKSSTVPSSNLDMKNKQDVMFMYGQLIKEILTRLPYSTVDVNHMFEFLFVKFIDEPSKIQEFIEFERDYKQHSAVWWYTKVCFYDILNKALRTHDILTLYSVRVFIHDLHQQLIQLHANSSKTNVPALYRGVLIPTEEFEKIKINSGGLLSINNFLSTTRNKAVAEIFADNSEADPTLVSVLFQINVDPSMRSATPFADIEALSNFGAGEEEYLFTMGSVFRIESIERSGINNKWCVKLKLTNDNDPDLARLTNSYRSLYISPNFSHTHICSLAMLMMTMDQSELATEILEPLLEVHVDPLERFKIYLTLGMLYTNLNKSQQALVNYEKIVNSYIPRLFLSINHIATIYAGLGELCMVLKKYELALINMEIAVGVEQLRRPQPDGRSLAHYYLFIGKIHTGLGNRNEALTYYQLAIDLAKQFYPRHHPLLAYCMTSKMSLLYQENRLEEIVPHFQESGNILANSLSNNHGMQVFVHMTTAQNLLDKGDCEGALRSYQAALQCSHQHIPSNHPKNAHILCPMAHVYNRQRRFDEALSILQNTLNIQTAALPANHSDLAITYTLLGEVFENQRNPLALSYYQRALDIQLRHRPPTDSITIHLQQAISRLQRRH